MKPMKKRICLFGTSANPPTGKGGHAGIVEYLASLEIPRPSLSPSPTTMGQQQQQRQNEKRFHQVRVLPVYKHMFDEKRDQQASYEDRLAMCHLAFQRIPNVVVSDDERRCFEWVAQKNGITAWEDKCKLRVGTADLLDMLLEQDESLEITLALGADTFMDLTRWKWRRSKDIITCLEGRIIVFQRISGIDNNNNGNSALIKEEELRERIHAVSKVFQDTCPNLSDNIMLVQVPSLSSISSSMVRTCTDEDFLLGALGPSVVQYIKDKKLYNWAAHASTS